MDSIIARLEEWARELLISIIQFSLSNMFGDVNDKVGTIAAQVGTTPQAWNASIFNMMRTLSETVIVPVAGIIIAYVLCYELISMVIDRNNLHDIDTWIFFKWLFKAWIAVFIVSHTFDITMAIFDLGQHLATSAAGAIHGSTAINVDAAFTAMQSSLDAMGIPELALLALETTIIQICMKVMSVIIIIVLYGRMIEIYLMCSIAPVPFATMVNREWGGIGNNFLKGLFALAFQGFIIMALVAIYSTLVNSMVVASNIHTAILQVVAYTVLLCFWMMKSGAFSKAIFNAH